MTCEVIDFGPGVPADDWAGLFKPFETARSTRPGGTGLGLSVARGFAEAMSAALTPRATPTGGLTMRLTLPRAVAE